MVNRKFVESRNQPRMASPSYLNQVGQYHSESSFQIKELGSKEIHDFSNPNDFLKMGAWILKGFCAHSLHCKLPQTSMLCGD